jgi:hypothetical protein
VSTQVKRFKNSGWPMKVLFEVHIYINLDKNWCMSEHSFYYFLQE